MTLQELSDKIDVLNKKLEHGKITKRRHGQAKKELMSAWKGNINKIIER